MFNNPDELYFIKPGQKLVFSQYDTTITDIYAEAVNMDTMLDIQNNIRGDYVVSIANNIRITEFVKTLVLSELKSATMTIPKEMNQGSLKSAVYQFMSMSGKAYRVSVQDQKITLVKKEKSDLAGKIESLPVGEKITIKSDNPLSTKIMAYRQAKRVGATVKVKLNRNGIEIVAIEKKNVDEKDYLKKFEQWVSALPYNRPHPIPQYLKRTDEAYIRTCISKICLDVEMKNGVLWRKQCCLKKRKGVTHLKYRDQVLYSFESNSSYIKAEHVDRINSMLKPYGMTYEDIK